MPLFLHILPSFFLQCNFDHGTGHYHISASAPFVPACFVGSTLGSYAEASVEEGLCPRAGRVNSYCKGDSSCKVRNQAIVKNRLFTVDATMILIYVVAVLDIIALIAFYYIREGAKGPIYPFDKPLRAVLPALFLWIFNRPIFLLCVSTDGGATVDANLVEKHLNNATGEP